ncbi:MAG: hypothetical protein R2867_16175 [Caldilineaceae bacterium]
MVELSGAFVVAAVAWPPTVPRAIYAAIFLIKIDKGFTTMPKVRATCWSNRRWSGCWLSVSALDCLPGALISPPVCRPIAT